MRKLTLLLLFFTVLTFLIGQESTFTLKVTADSLYQMALIEDDATQVRKLLEGANVRYNRFAPQENAVHVKALLALSLANEGDSLALTYARESIDMGEKYFGDRYHPLTFEAYAGRMFYSYSYDLYVGIEAGNDALRVNSSPSENYFTIQHLLINAYTNTFQPKRLGNVIGQLDSVLYQTGRTGLQQFEMVYFEGKMYASFLETNREQATIYGEQCLDLNEKYDFYDPSALAIIMSDLGMFYGQTLNFDKALYWSNQGMETSGLAPDDPERSNYLMRKAMIYRSMEKYDEAISTLERAIELMKTDEEKYAGSLGVALYNYSVFLYRRHEYAAAIKAIRACYAYGLDGFNIDSHHGVLLSRQKRYESALQFTQSALIKLSNTFNDTSIWANPNRNTEFRRKDWAVNILNTKSGSAYKLAVRDHDEKWLDLAESTNQLAMDIAIDQRSDLIGFEISQLHSNPFFERIMLTRLMIRLLRYEMTGQPQQLEEAFRALEQKKAGNLVRTLKKAKLPGGLSEQLTIARKELSLARQGLQTAASDSVAFYRQRVFAANEKLEALAADYRERFPQQSSYFYDIPYPSLEELQKQLAPGELLIDYIVSENRGCIFAISAQEVKVEILKDIMDLPQKIARYHALLQSPLLVQTKRKEAFITLSGELYELLLAPLQTELNTATQLTIFPDGALYTLPFETLMSTGSVDQPFEDLPFLLKSHTINYHYSATAFQLRQKNKPILNQSLLAFAPVFADDQKISAQTRNLPLNVDTLVRSIDGGIFEPLPASRTEVLTIKEILPAEQQQTILLDDAANQQNLLVRLQEQSYQFIHIATHGLVNVNDPTLSGLACFPDAKGDNDLLYVSQIQFTPIQADLVVLSSCDSGIGQLVKGEGLLALNRAFIYAGARNVISSLWKVEDRQSSKLMVAFYEHLQKEMSYTDALRKAKLSFLENPLTALPRYWSPFLLMGE